MTDEERFRARVHEFADKPVNELLNELTTIKLILRIHGVIPENYDDRCNKLVDDMIASINKHGHNFQ